MGREASWWSKAVVSTLAAAGAGAAAGALVGAAGGLLDLQARAALGTAAGLAIALLPLLKVPLPQRNGETPQSLLERGPMIWSLSNGALLGAAVTNRIGFWLWYLVPAGCLISGSAALGAALWGTYAFCRLAVIDVVAWRMQRTGCQIEDLTERLVRGRSRARTAMAALALFGGVLFALAVGR